MKKIAVSLLVLITLSTSILSQTRTWIQSASAVKFRLDGNRGDGIDYQNTKGSPYLFPQLKDGRVITSDNEEIVCKLRLDAFADEMELLVEEKSYLITKPDGFKDFYIDSLNIRYIPYIADKDSKKAYMIVNTDGIYSLFTKKVIVYMKADEPKPYTDVKPERFEQKDDEFYVSYKNSPAQHITSLKKLVKNFPDLKTVVESYPEKRVDFDKEKELSKLVEFINSKVQ